jgi:hypothetical protein
MKDRLLGEWMAFWWLLSGVAWNCWDGLTWIGRGVRAWRRIRPYRKCRECGEWKQNQVLIEFDGLCQGCDAYLEMLAGQTCNCEPEELSDDDVPF